MLNLVRNNYEKIITDGDLLEKNKYFITNYFIRFGIIILLPDLLKFIRLQVR